MDILEALAIAETMEEFLALLQPDDEQWVDCWEIVADHSNCRCALKI